MKKLIYLLCAVFFASVVIAQDNTSGKVSYEQVLKLEIKLEGDAAQFAHMLPKERKSNKVLYFSSESSLYENGAEQEEKTISMHGGENVMAIKMHEPENKVFTSFKNKKKNEQKEIRVFLIEGELSHQWKITGEQKMILDFPCQQAVIEEDSTKTFAWFTPAIPVSAGPANFGGLPGLILSIESGDGKMTTTATEVDFSEVDKEKLSAPKKGKKVSREEFDQIVEEKMKEMGAEGGKGGTQMIFRIHQ